MQRITEELKELVNVKYNDLINKTIKNRLGVEVKMSTDDYGRVTDSVKTDVDKKMRGNKILRRLFSSANLYGYAYQVDNDPHIGIRFNVGYRHHDYGSNGHEMMTLFINKETGKVIVRY